ncbi:hypothetical protein DUNSADRAFT_10946 [Dunaliella salina]|uniref:Uncharacterized protein n=1 Tax=Dunaliella salina TaxID=3046 RepID=A0ABQ7GEF4_DUNSA|nr:hypothetical protein DUNSADRAFT_10946 [Dunaliella salina]|eukprot:KAF5832990.1 hypothetical protein DUNSADRAFT_10946 [Dunaliella salina]
MTWRWRGLQTLKAAAQVLRWTHHPSPHNPR